MATATMTADQLKKEMAELKAAQKEIADAKGKKLADGTPDPDKVFGKGPHVREGEDPLTSRGYSILKMVKARLGHMEGDSGAWNSAKVEQGIHEEFKASEFGNGFGGKASFEGGSLAPFGSDFLPDESKTRAGTSLKQHIKGIVSRSVENVDWEEVYHLAKRFNLMQPGQYGAKAGSVQSWLDTTLGGALVGPPTFGEPIDLWRNQDALIRAGATFAPMPPTGRFTFPRQTNASVAYHVGESQAGTTTNIKVGQINLSAKKLMALLVYSREILQFGGAAAEMLFRMDVTRSMTLGADKAMLEGPGSDTIPLGIINTPNISVVTPGTAASGSTGALLSNANVYDFPSAILENNVPDISGCKYIMRPVMYYALLKRQATVLVAGDSQGLFQFSPLRSLGDNMNTPNINGNPVILSTQVSKTRYATGTSGATQTYILYGYWPDYWCMMAPLMEFVVATQGNPAQTSGVDLFANDQFCLKTIMFYDGALRHPGAVAWCDALQQA